MPSKSNGQQPSPEAARAGLELYLATLPPEMRERYRKFNLAQLTEQLGGNGHTAIAERLLPDLRVDDAADLQVRRLPKLVWIVPDLLPAGWTFLAGKPKVGKSWLAMQLALSMMASGMMFDKQVERGSVLYLALEDSPRRFQDRMKKQQWPSMRGLVSLVFYEAFHDQLGPLDAGGAARLIRYAEKAKYRAIIIDTFTRAFSRDQHDAREMTAAIGPMQQWAVNSNVAIIAIDHQRKGMGGAVDGITDLYGSIAKTGTMDTSWSLYKEQGKRGAKLQITGRDVDEVELKLDFDKTGFYWHCEGLAHDVEMTERRKAVADALETLGQSDVATIAREVGQDIANTRKRLNDLCNSGLVTSHTVAGRVLYSAIEPAKK